MDNSSSPPEQPCSAPAGPLLSHSRCRQALCIRPGVDEADILLHAGVGGHIVCALCLHRQTGGVDHNLTVDDLHPVATTAQDNNKAMFSTMLHLGEHIGHRCSRKRAFARYQTSHDADHWQGLGWIW